MAVLRKKHHIITRFKNEALPYSLDNVALAYRQLQVSEDAVTIRYSDTLLYTFGKTKV
ncbi:MAG: hypothetical protein LBE37_15940 [Sphingobacterium sp.]|nr:hypothetical protein [Sphingobacterium sp.]